MDWGATVCSPWTAALNRSPHAVPPSLTITLSLTLAQKNYTSPLAGREHGAKWDPVRAG